MNINKRKDVTTKCKNKSILTGKDDKKWIEY